MSLNDPLANVLSHIMVQDRKGRQYAVVKPSTRIIKKVLSLLNENRYLGTFRDIKDGQSAALEVSLIGAINKVGVIKPRYKVSVAEYKKFEKRYLPAFGFGILIVSTSNGLMTQEEAIKQNIGGRLLAYVY